MTNYDHLRIPKYVQLMIKLKEQIESNILKPGSPLPTRDRLMKEYGLSLSTVTRAINELERQGWLISRQGSGTFVVQRYSGAQEKNNDIKTIGVLLPSSNLQAVELAQEISAEAKNHFLRIIAMFSPDDEEKELDQAKYLFEHNVDGLIWIPIQPKKHIGVASLFAKNKKPAVICENVTEKTSPYFMRVCRDYYGGLREAIRHLQELGHKRIAYIGPKNTASDFGPVQERWNAYRDSMREQNLWEPDELVLHPTVFQEWQHYSSRVKNLFEKHNAPTAIVGYNDTIALDAARSLTSIGFRLPEDISIIGAEDSIASQFSNPRLSTVSLCNAEYVDAVFRALRQLFSEELNEDHESTILVPQRLIHRDSAKPVGNMLAAN